MTSAAFGSVISWFPTVLAVAVFFFAFSTMISWSYYGERCWTSLFGDGSSMVYRLTFLGFTALGPMLELNNVITFSDLMILSLGIPNILGMILLSSKVSPMLKDYMARLKSGEIKPVK